MISSNTLPVYISKFQKLRQGNTAYGLAPHKPILLLSVIHQIEKGNIIDNRIYLTADLVSEFIETFNLLVDTANRPEFTLPFYHLMGEKFWYLKPKSGMILRGYVKSINVLNEIIDYAYVDVILFELLMNFESRQMLKITLLDSYFAKTKQIYFEKRPDTKDFILNIEKYILKEPDTNYSLNLSVKNEDEQFVRGSLFKKLIPKLYNLTCSISRMHVTSYHGYQLIDACHIKPISISNDDTVSNGFALSPTLHRAFDRGIIGVNSDYRVMVSRYINEDENTNHSFKKLEGTRLYLPMPSSQYPKVENFLWHLDKIFEK